MPRSETPWHINSPLPIWGFTVPGQAEVCVLMSVHGKLETCLKATDCRPVGRAELHRNWEVSGVVPTSQVGSGTSLKPECHKWLIEPSTSRLFLRRALLFLSVIQISPTHPRHSRVCESSERLITPSMERCTPEGKGQERGRLAHAWGIYSRAKCGWLWQTITTHSRGTGS